MNLYEVGFTFSVSLGSIKTAFHHEGTEEHEEKQCIIRPSCPSW
jgi:hypothetical protein